MNNKKINAEQLPLDTGPAGYLPGCQMAPLPLDMDICFYTQIYILGFTFFLKPPSHTRTSWKQANVKTTNNSKRHLVITL